MRAVLLGLLAAAACDPRGAAQAAPLERIHYDLARSSHTLEGFGANVWPGCPAAERVFRGLGMRFARLWIGCHGSPPPPDAPREAFDAYWRASPGLAPAVSTGRALAARGVRILLGLGAPPEEWMGPGKRLRPEFHEAFARLWGAAVHVHNDAGVPVRWIELYNEPDGNWSVHVPPADNARVIRLVRAELDARGLRDVGIAAPGTAHADHGPAGDPWVEAMDPATAAAVAVWSNHAWEWNLRAIHAPNGGAYLRDAWSGFLGSVRRKDPERTRPIYVTEYATKAHVFDGIDLGDPGKGRSERCATDTVPYAIRVVENTLHLANAGAQALLVWEAADQPWSNHEWGLVKRPEKAGEPRPVYHALRAVLPHIPPDSRVLVAGSPAPTVASAAFRRGPRLVWVAANGSTETSDVEAAFAGASRLRAVETAVFAGGGAQPRASLSGATVRARLPPRTVITVVLNIEQGRRRAGSAALSGP